VFGEALEERHPSQDFDPLLDGHHLTLLPVCY
jgi:hypothetical protein